MWLFENFLSLNGFYFNCDLWNMGDNSGERILISYFDMAYDYFLDWKYCDMNC